MISFKKSKIWYRLNMSLQPELFLVVHYEYYSIYERFIKGAV